MTIKDTQLETWITDHQTAIKEYLDSLTNNVSMNCDKCAREVHPWPFKRGAKCSPDYWAFCIRNDGEYLYASLDHPSPPGPVNP